MNNMYAPYAAVPKNIVGVGVAGLSASTTPTKTDTFSASGIISSVVFVTQNPNNTISNGNSAAGIKDAKNLFWLVIGF